MTRGASQSVPTPMTSEFARVVATLPVGAPPTPLAARLAAPTSDGAAPVKVITVIEAASELFRTAVTVDDARAVVVNAYQISAVPSCALDCTARFHVSTAPVFVMLLTTVFTPSTGASAEMNATINALAVVVKAGLVTVRFGALALRTNVPAIVGAGPIETTRLTAVPTGTFLAATGSWLMTVPGGKIKLLAVVTTPTTRPAPVIEAVATACVRPMTLGTTARGAMATSRFTRPPSASLVPAAGAWLRTVPTGTVTVSMPTESPTNR